MLRGEERAARQRLSESIALAVRQGAVCFEVRSRLALARLGESSSRARIAELVAALGPALRGPERAEALALPTSQRASGRPAG